MPSAKPLVAVFLLATATAAAVSLPACGPAKVVPTPEPIKEEKRKAPNQPKPAEKADPDGIAAHALSWRSNKPAQISVILKDGVTASSEPVFSYEPNPPDVVMELQAGPGTPSFQLVSAELTWLFQPTGQDEPTKVGPQKLPLAPTNVVGAPSDQPGEPFTVRIPIGIMTAKDWFTGANQTPKVGSATVQVEFFDAQGKSVFGTQTLIPLRVPIRITLK